MSKTLCLKVRLRAGLSALVFIVMAMSASSYLAVQKLSSLSNFADKKSEGQALVLTIDDILNRQKSEYRAFLLTSQEDYMSRYTEENSKIAETSAKLDSVLTTEQGRDMKARLMRSVDKYHQLIGREVDLCRSGQRNAAIALLTDPQSSVLRREVDKNMADLLDRQVKRKAEARHEQAGIESRTTTIVISLALLGVVLAFVVSFLLSRSVTCSLQPIIALIQEIAANNLTVDDVQVTTGDEIGGAAKALNYMKNNLRNVVRSISTTAEHVASASEEISSSASQQAQSAQTQKDQAAQVATAMQQMSSTVLEVSANSNKAAEASRQAAETARKGGTIVEETLHQMRAMAESVGGTAKKVEELGKSSEQIGRIIGVIDDIADQTNLLALNAAIEAARAGEQGRGFAVVADEVRKLAERTTGATKEITQMIRNIQDETRSAVSAMEQGTRQVEQGVSSTAKAGEALREIIDVSEQVGEMITHIATAATEQSSATDEVNNNMDQIARLVKESSVGAEESAKACQSLSGLAFDLQKMVAEFKVDDVGTQPASEYAPGPDNRPKTFSAAAAS